MDGHFVPNITFGINLIKSLQNHPLLKSLALDCHLMVENPAFWVDSLIELQVSAITVHVENTPHLHRLVSRIREKGIQAGVAINPATPIEMVKELTLHQWVDFVLVMTVNPGFGGQKLIPQTLQKITTLSQNVPVRADGGIDLSTIGEVFQAGASSVVAGNAIFGVPDPKTALQALKDVCLTVLQRN
jgi:ribulose-phosphate 3-epimerase